MRVAKYTTKKPVDSLFGTFCPSFPGSKSRRRSLENPKTGIAIEKQCGTMAIDARNYRFRGLLPVVTTGHFPSDRVHCPVKQDHHTGQHVQQGSRSGVSIAITQTEVEYGIIGPFVFDFSRLLSPGPPGPSSARLTDFENQRRCRLNHLDQAQFLPRPGFLPASSTAGRGHLPPAVCQVARNSRVITFPPGWCLSPRPATSAAASTWVLPSRGDQSPPLIAG